MSWITGNGMCARRLPMLCAVSETPYLQNQSSSLNPLPNASRNISIRRTSRTLSLISHSRTRTRGSLLDSAQEETIAPGYSMSGMTTLCSLNHCMSISRTSTNSSGPSSSVTAAPIYTSSIPDFVPTTKVQPRILIIRCTRYIELSFF